MKKKDLKDLKPGKYRYLGEGIIAYRTTEGKLVYGIRWRERWVYKQKMIGSSKTEAAEVTSWDSLALD